MNKRHLLIVPLAAAIAFVVPIRVTADDFTLKTDNTEIPTATVLDSQSDNESKEELAELYIAMMDKIGTTDDRLEWYLEYKELFEDIEDPPETIYDYFTDDELAMLYGVVEAEVGDLGGFDEKCNVASVIFNRIYNEEFGDTVDAVLTSDEFTTIRNGRYLNVEITDETILACEFAFAIMDTTDGALFFEGMGSNVHSKYATYLFTDNAGHSFYK